MQFHNLGSDGQPETKMSDRAGTPLAPSKNLLSVLRSNSGTEIRDSDDGLVFVPTESDRHLGPLWGTTQSVLHEVFHDSLNLVRVSDDRTLVGANSERLAPPRHQREAENPPARRPCPTFEGPD